MSPVVIRTFQAYDRQFSMKKALCNMFAVVIYSLPMFAFCAVNVEQTNDSLSILSLKFTSVFSPQILPEDHKYSGT